MTCNTCPFAETAEAEQAQNYGCLPTRQDIMTMHRDDGRDWACHGNATQVCAGLVAECREHGVSFDKSAPLVDYAKWYRDGIG